MTYEAEQLLQALADGEARSPAGLARALGTTPAALEPAARRLAEWGLRIVRTAGEDWRLQRPVELLDAADLRRRIGPRAPLATLEVLTEIDSTNARLLAAPAPPPGSIAVCTAEFQTAGRGRRGRTWSCPLGAGLCVSIAWQLAAASDLGALTLAAGVAARRAIARVSGVEVGLKWPNDLLWDGRKLGGILVEATALPSGGRRVVAGVGINVTLPRDGALQHGDWRPVDLDTATGGRPPTRAALAAELIVEIAALLESYAATGFGPYRAEWDAADAIVGRPITLDEDGERSAARAVAIADDGSLVVATEGGDERRVLSGDVSVRGA
jgi:BirA family biotin operon repressor/biotin-[acetyl-CoA-carboxylase] ligase